MLKRLFLFTLIMVIAKLANAQVRPVHTNLENVDQEIIRKSEALSQIIRFQSHVITQQQKLHLNRLLDQAITIATQNTGGQIPIPSPNPGPGGQMMNLQEILLKAQSSFSFTSDRLTFLQSGLQKSNDFSARQILNMCNISGSSSEEINCINRGLQNAPHIGVIASLPGQLILEICSAPQGSSSEELNCIKQSVSTLSDLRLAQDIRNCELSFSFSSDKLACAQRVLQSQFF